MTHDNTDEPAVKAAHPWAVLEGDTPLFHVPGTFPPEYAVEPQLEALWRAKQPLKYPGWRYIQMPLFAESEP